MTVININKGKPQTMALAPIVGAGASLLGGLLAKKGAEKTNAMQMAMAQKQMDFQERMSSTAHQRQVKDLQLAGLNPILSAGGSGASSPGGAQANIINEMAPALSSAVQIQTMQQQLKNLKSQEDLNRANIRKTDAQKDGIEYDNSKKRPVANTIDAIEGVFTGNTSAKGISEGGRSYTEASKNKLRELNNLIQRFRD